MMSICSISTRSVFERGVAGVRPRPSLRVPVGVHARRPAPRRCRGSAPALVARSTRRPATECGCLGVAGVSAPALVARGSPRTRRSAASGRRCRGSAPALVARTRPVLPHGVAGFGSGPRCANVAIGVAIRATDRALPGFGPGPRCAVCGGDTPSGSRLLTLPGFGPGPRCARYEFRGKPSTAAGVAGVRPRPSLCRRLAGHGRRHLPGRCRGSAPALIAQRQRCAGSPSCGHDVAGVRPRPSLRGRVPRLRERPDRGVAGFGPGPRCAITPSDPRMQAKCLRCRGQARPSLRVGSDDRAE